MKKFPPVGFGDFFNDIHSSSSTISLAGHVGENIMTPSVRLTHRNISATKKQIIVSYNNVLKRSKHPHINHMVCTVSKALPMVKLKYTIFLYKGTWMFSQTNIDQS